MTLPLLLPCLLGQAPLPAPGPLREAQAFMDAYAEELRRGDREALARRYDPRGSWQMGRGAKRFATPQETRRRYLEAWRPPTSFQWRDLSYEVLGPDAVVVTGLFDWGRPDGVRTTSYTGLLVRQAGQLRIRVEDESSAPTPAPAPEKAP